MVAKNCQFSRKEGHIPAQRSCKEQKNRSRKNSGRMLAARTSTPRLPLLVCGRGRGFGCASYCLDVGARHIRSFLPPHALMPFEFLVGFYKLVKSLLGLLGIRAVAVATFVSFLFLEDASSVSGPAQHPVMLQEKSHAVIL